MTRINCVPVTVLSDKHLLAEYKEITRPFNKIIKRIEKENLDFTIPSKYVLGSGHETFFFDKLEWLWYRYGDIYIELKGRGFDVNGDKYSDIAEHFFNKLGDTIFWNTWKPTPEDMYVNMARLVHREFGGLLDQYK